MATKSKAVNNEIPEEGKREVADPTKMITDILAKVAASVAPSKNFPDKMKQELFAKVLDVMSQTTQWVLKPTPIWLARDDNTFSLVLELRLVKAPAPPEE